jgi:hypothetical protein
VGELAVAKGVISFLCAILSGIFCLPMLIYGSWLLKLWITIQLQRPVYLEYSYLKIGMLFMSLGIAALLCALYAARRRGYWSALFAFPVIAGLWTMVVVSSIIPNDTKSAYHIQKMASELKQFGSEHGRFPDRETTLPAASSKELSPYYQQGSQLPFRIVWVPNATGPFLNSPGPYPGVMFYAVSADQQDVWLTGTELRFPRTTGNNVQFLDFLSADGDTRALHLHAAQTPASK